VYGVLCSDLSNAQVSILIGAKWNEMSEQEKQPFIEGAQKIKEVLSLLSKQTLFNSIQFNSIELIAYFALNIELGI
jgi:hypothetical protein